MNGTEPDYVNCDVGNPFPKQQTAKFTIRMRVDDLNNIDVTQLNFNFTVNSSYAEDLDASNNKYEGKVTVRVVLSYHHALYLGECTVLIVYLTAALIN